MAAGAHRNMIIDKALKSRRLAICLSASLEECGGSQESSTVDGESHLRMESGSTVRSTAIRSSSRKSSKGFSRRLGVPVCHEVRAAEALRLPHHQHRPRADHRVPRPRQRSARLSQRMPAPGNDHRAPSFGKLFRGAGFGEPKRMTRMFHAWQYDMRGNCRVTSAVVRKAIRSGCARRMLASGGCAAR